MILSQAGSDRFMYNLLLEILMEEFRRTGRAGTSRGRISAWYTKRRNETGPWWLKKSVSYITRQKMYELCLHYSQYVESERAKAAGVKPGTVWGEPHFKRRGERISLL